MSKLPALPSPLDCSFEVKNAPPCLFFLERCVSPLGPGGLGPRIPSRLGNVKGGASPGLKGREAQHCSRGPALPCASACLDGGGRPGRCQGFAGLLSSSAGLGLRCVRLYLLRSHWDRLLCMFHDTPCGWALAGARRGDGGRALGCSEKPGSVTRLSDLPRRLLRLSCRPLALRLCPALRPAPWAPLRGICLFLRQVCSRP